MRVIPNDGYCNEHKLVHLSKTPDTQFIETVVGGKLERIEGFDTILFQDRPIRCLAFRARCELDYEQNTYANMLWLQALLRETGFSTTETPDSIKGPIAIFFGEDGFTNALIWSLLEIPMAG